MVVHREKKENGLFKRNKKKKKKRDKISGSRHKIVLDKTNLDGTN
jgi:hypothetical protein